MTRYALSGGFVAGSIKHHTRQVHGARLRNYATRIPPFRPLSVIAFDNTPDGNFAVAKVRIEAFKWAAAQLGLPIAFGGEVEQHIPDNSHRLLHQHGGGHHC